MKESQRIRLIVSRLEMERLGKHLVFTKKLEQSLILYITIREPGQDCTMTMSWAAGSGHCLTQVSTNPGRRSSDNGRLDNQTLDTVIKPAQGWVLRDSGTTRVVNMGCFQSALMSEVRILTSEVSLLCFSLPLCFHYSGLCSISQSL